MDAGDLFRVGELLIAAIALLPEKRWPYEDRPFALAADLLAKEGNSLAKAFRITDGVLGRHSHEFREMRTLMHSATLISYDSQSQDTFNIRIGPGGAQRLLRRIEATDIEKTEAAALVLANWKEAYGRAWKAGS